MASEKQIQANRQNALLSTGPKSASGKANSSQNALKHGLTGQVVVISGEDPAEFDDLRLMLWNQYEPHGVAEEELVDRIAAHLWRLRRVPAFEAAVFSWTDRSIKVRDAYESQKGYRDQVPSYSPPAANGDATWRNKEVLGRYLVDIVSRRDVLAALNRHESAQQKLMIHAFGLLEKLQEQRKTAAKARAAASTKQN
jgi:hypothetical protein